MFTCRIDLEVQSEDGRGEDDALELTIRGVVEAENSVEAMRKIAAKVDAAVVKRLGRS